MQKVGLVCILKFENIDNTWTLSKILARPPKDHTLYMDSP